MSLIIDAMDQCELTIYEYLILKASQKWMAELLTSLFLSIAKTNIPHFTGRLQKVCNILIYIFIEL